MLRKEAFDESVMENMIDTETRRRHPITTHWTVDWDVATIIEALEELYPLQAEHRHLDLGFRSQQVIDRSGRQLGSSAEGYYSRME